MTDNRPIGVCDSGIGGLSVFSKVERLLPGEKFVYFGDTANIPYGTKSAEELHEITKRTMNFFKAKNVKAVILACNTISAVLFDKLKEESDFTIYPVLQTSIKMLAKTEKLHSVGVLATETTVSSHAYANELKKNIPGVKVFEHGCPGSWVKTVEENLPQTPENLDLIRVHLDEVLKYSPDKIILGCTHYPYLMRFLAHFAEDGIFINPALYCAKFVEEDLRTRGMLASEKPSKTEFYTSSEPEKFRTSAEVFYPLLKTPTQINTEDY